MLNGTDSVGQVRRGTVLQLRRTDDATTQPDELRSSRHTGFMGLKAASAATSQPRTCQQALTFVIPVESAADRPSVTQG